MNPAPCRRPWSLAALVLLLAVGPSSLAAEVTAKDRDFWSFRPLHRPAVPPVKDAGRARTPVDAFLLARLREKGLTFSAEADRVTLVRRAAYDLTGLPPTPEEVDAFLADDRPDAYERLVERLLASPHFGECWGRHWLDGAGYADTFGGDNDAAGIFVAEGKWRYRDWVARAFNADLPFDTFLTEQLAGDELGDWRQAPAYSPETLGRLVATGFLRNVTDNTAEDELNTPDLRHQVLYDTLEVLGSNLLGLTLQCARCHDHKFEPVSQKDYFRLMALFTPAYNPETWLQPYQRSGTSTKPKYRELFDVSERERLEIDRRNAAVRMVGGLAAPQRTYGKLQALYDVGPPPETHLLRRGNYLHPGDVVEPGFPAVLQDPERPASVPAPEAGAPTSGRRLALARWLTDGRTPAGGLVARVRVNRVWQQLFGQGLVATGDNLGRSGSPPTHPELLDWLAGEFVEGGWRLKPLLRTLVTSAAYRQTATHAAGSDGERADPGNDLLWRMRLRRLESEGVRDTLLAVGGNLDTTAGGPALPLEVRPDGKVVIKEQGLPTPTSRWRRSLYVLARRNYHLSLLNTFDQPVLATNCTGRQASAVVGQPLTMLNDSFVRDQADRFAGRVERAAGTPEKQVAAAFRIALGREPKPDEAAACVELLRRHAERFGDRPPAEAAHRALAELCHVLLNTNELLYVP
jgi:hypothetical protein